MTSRFLADNRWLLKLCSDVARFVGLLALLGTVLLIAVLIVGPAMGAMDASALAKSRSQLVLALPAIAFYGVFALIFSEFLLYLLAGEGEPKWILRHGSKIIYAYVLYFIAMTLHVALHMESTGEPNRMDFQHILPLSLLIASSVLKALIWIGIGVALQKVVPIIRESKTLV